MFTNIEEVEVLTEGWRSALGHTHTAYKNHIYRVINLCAVQQHLGDEALRKVVIAACFHDIAIWLDDTFDYLGPSSRHAETYLKAQGLARWNAEVRAMIEQHHKMTVFEAGGLVELFRRADWIDVTLGLRRFGLPREVVREVRDRFSNAGFHLFLLRRTAYELIRRPWRPLPMVRW